MTIVAGAATFAGSRACGIAAFVVDAETGCALGSRTAIASERQQIHFAETAAITFAPQTFVVWIGCGRDRAAITITSGTFFGAGASDARSCAFVIATYAVDTESGIAFRRGRAGIAQRQRWNISSRTSASTGTSASAGTATPAGTAIGRRCESDGRRVLRGDGISIGVGNRCGYVNFVGRSKGQT